MASGFIKDSRMKRLFSILYFILLVVRNLFFHPLSNFPGPKHWAATDLTNTYYILKGTRVYKVAELHDLYGSVVRIGPRQLSYIDEEAWKSIYAYKEGGELKKYMAPQPDHLYGIFATPILPIVTALLEFAPVRFFMWLRGRALPGLIVIFRDIVTKAFRHREAELGGEKSESDVPDYISYLSKNMGTPKGLSTNELGMAGGDLLVAGSDTVATVLAGATYHLLTNPSKLKTLIKEIRSTFRTEADITLAAVYGLKYNNAVINETMRLFPAGPETTPRIVGLNGNMICGGFLPARTVVGVFHWAAGHNKASWKNPDSFVPERWLDDEEYKHDRRGVLQFFNTGPRNCLGQPLANAEKRLILAKVFWNFDLELCEESRNWLDMQIFGLTYNKRPLMVKAKPIAR